MIEVTPEMAASLTFMQKRNLLCDLAKSVLEAGCPESKRDRIGPLLFVFGGKVMSILLSGNKPLPEKNKAWLDQLAVADTETFKALALILTPRQHYQYSATLHYLVKELEA
jgi:hypothetical protein